ncbi:substrate-binding domain-containing protein [Sphingomonas sp. MMS24-JH45]
MVAISPGATLPRDASSVAMDDEAAGHAVAARLIALGHRRFGFVQGVEHHLAAERRWHGALRALAEAGLDERAVTARRGNFTFRSGSELLPELLAERPDLTAIACANDDMAVGVLFAAHQRGLSVPAQLSITGFDDTPVSALVWPPLTTSPSTSRSPTWPIARSKSSPPGCATATGGRGSTT